MICRTCQAEDQKSCVYHGGETRTLMATDNYWDEDGTYHHHDPNTYTVTYMCSRGHRWTEEHRNTCWCGWQVVAA